jgi:hypothetical protein
MSENEYMKIKMKMKMKVNMKMMSGLLPARVKSLLGVLLAGSMPHLGGRGGGLHEQYGYGQEDQ